MGTSLEDYLIMKNEFESLKKQISFIEGLTQTMDEKQQTQNELYEERIKLFSLQLAELKHNVKEMKQEIFTILNEISINKHEADSVKDSSSVQMKNDSNNSNDKLTPTNEIQPTDNQSSIVSTRPSYNQLRNLTNQVLQPQKNHENIDSFEETVFIGNQKDQRYFNQQYFQTISSHPNYTYNKNSGKTPIRLKKNDKVQDGPTNNSERDTMSPSIDRVSGDVNTTVDHTPINTNGNASKESEVSYPNAVMEKDIQKIDTQTESLDIESKKQKNSMFYNLFRKQN